MIRLCFALCACLWVASAAADPLPEAQGQLFLDFARDVSRNDPEVMATAERFVSTPPTKLEEIGFYGGEDAPAPERTLRGIISALTAGGHFISVEDKYVYEFPALLLQNNLAEAGDAPDDLDVLSFFAEFDWDSGAEPDWTAFKAFFVAHTQAIEAAVTRKNRRLLSLQLPLGDTLYFWTAPPDVAERWRNVALYAGVNTQTYSKSVLATFSVTDPDWQSYWWFMTYALNIPADFEGLPDGL